MTMPDLTREILHQELARIQANPPPPRTATWTTLSALWPRLTWGGAGVIGLTLVFWLLILRPTSPPSPAPMQMAQQLKAKDSGPQPAAISAVPTKEIEIEKKIRAPSRGIAIDVKNEDVARAPELVRPAQPTAPLPQSPLMVAAASAPSNRTDNQSNDRAVGTKLASPAPAGPAASRQLARVRESALPMLRDQAEKAPAASLKVPPPQSASAAPPPATVLAMGRSVVAVPSNESVQLGGAFQAGTAGNAERYYFSQDLPTNRYRRNFNSPAPLNVLNSFELEYTGNQVRVVDQDGSVYEGRMEPQTAASQNMASQTRPVMPADAANSVNSGSTVSQYGAFRANLAQAEETITNAPNFFFRVAGTNRNLRQTVVFTGNFIPVSNSNRTPLTSANALPSPTDARSGITILQNDPLSVQSAPAQTASPVANQAVNSNGGVIQGQALVGGNTVLTINAVQKTGQ